MPCGHIVSNKIHKLHGVYTINGFMNNLRWYFSVRVPEKVTGPHDLMNPNHIFGYCIYGKDLDKTYRNKPLNIDRLDREDTNIDDNDQDSDFVSNNDKTRSKTENNSILDMLKAMAANTKSMKQGHRANKDNDFSSSDSDSSDEAKLKPKPKKSVTKPRSTDKRSNPLRTMLRASVLPENKPKIPYRLERASAKATKAKETEMQTRAEKAKETVQPSRRDERGRRVVVEVNSTK